MDPYPTLDTRGIELRAARQADAEFLYGLLKATMQDYVAQIWGWDEEWQRAYFQEHFDPGQEQIVILEGAEIGVLAIEETEDAVFLSKVYILPEYQGQGIGTHLIRSALDRAFGRGLPVTLRVLKVNPARRLYERLGFVVVGETETHTLMKAMPTHLQNGPPAERTHRGDAELAEGMRDSALDFYAQPSFLTDPGPHAGLFSALPDDLPGLCRVVQGLLIHPYWAGAYGYSIPEARATEYQIREVARKLERILELDDRPLLEPRPPERRLVGNCRDYAVLMTAMLRYKGVPVRTRCGFGAYFCPGWYEDHLICEVWRAEEGRWAFVDAQLDDVHREALRFRFDPCDVPRDQYLPGGMAWLMCRRGEADPNSFGYGNTVGGLPNIRGNLVRDVAFLNRVEILGWDYWGLIEGEDSDLDEEDLALLDEAATLSLAGNERFPELRSLYLRDMRLRVPRMVKRYDDETFTCEDILNGDPSLVKHL